MRARSTSTVPCVMIRRANLDDGHLAEIGADYTGRGPNCNAAAMPAANPCSMGKSSLVKAAHATVNSAARSRGSSSVLKLIEIHREDIESLPDLMTLLRPVTQYRFLVFCDDLSFDAADISYKSLKALLEGGI